MGLICLSCSGTFPLLGFWRRQHWSDRKFGIEIASWCETHPQRLFSPTSPIHTFRNNGPSPVDWGLDLQAKSWSEGQILWDWHDDIYDDSIRHKCLEFPKVQKRGNLWLDKSLGVFTDLLVIPMPKLPFVLQSFLEFLHSILDVFCIYMCAVATVFAFEDSINFLI